VAFTLSETPVPIERGAPGFAEANDYVFGELLGKTAAELEQIEATGVVVRVPVVKS
jgi:hypothetical protein